VLQCVNYRRLHQEKAPPQVSVHSKRTLHPSLEFCEPQSEGLDKGFPSNKASYHYKAEQIVYFLLDDALIHLNFLFLIPQKKSYKTPCKPF
jgi:hypothetical protein